MTTIIRKLCRSYTWLAILGLLLCCLSPRPLPAASRTPRHTTTVAGREPRVEQQTVKLKKAKKRPRAKAPRRQQADGSALFIALIWSAIILGTALFAIGYPLNLFALWVVGLVLLGIGAAIALFLGIIFIYARGGESVVGVVLGIFLGITALFFLVFGLMFLIWGLLSGYMPMWALGIALLGLFLFLMAIFIAAMAKIK